MKNNLLISIIVLLTIIMFASCANTADDVAFINENNSMPLVSQSQGEEAFESLEFSSLDDFLNAYIANKEGRDIVDFVEWQAEATLDYESKSVASKNTAENINLTSLEKLHLPIGIPEDFTIRRITVSEYGIVFRYLPKDIDVSSDTFWSAMMNNPSFELSILKHDYENVMEAILSQRNQTVNDLIDGKVSFRQPNRFNWEQDGLLFGLYVPLKFPDAEVQEHRTLNALTNDEILEMVKFTETRTVNLLNTNEVMALIEDSSTISREDNEIATDEVTFDSLIDELFNDE
ncbi:MAG: hypothetical protein LBC86_09900 [Oscillospiraceae bacterium]|jgi:hypothetical protein|nr:hypothetical protein [Oscillospiraceae bacterium]